MRTPLKYLFLVGLIWKYVFSLSGFETADKRLNDHLTQVSHPLVLPRTNTSHTVNVKVSLALNYLIDIDDRKEVFTAVIWIVQEWVSPLMAWNASDYDGITSHILSTKDIWTPRIWILNLIESERADESVYGDDYPAFVTHTGTVLIYPTYQMMTSCNLDLYKYPFDKQVCPIDLVSWTHRAEDVSFELLQEPFTTHTYAPGEWSLTDFKYTGKQVLPAPYPPANFSIIHFELRLRRNPTLSLMTTIFPLYMLNIIVMASLFMEPGDNRINMGMSAFLSYTMLLLVVMESLPSSSSSMPFIGLLFLCSLTFTLVCTLWTLALGKLKKEEAKPTFVWRKTCPNPLSMVQNRHRRKAESQDSIQSEMTDPEPPSFEKDATPKVIRESVDMMSYIHLVDWMLFLLYLIFNIATAVVMAIWNTEY